MRQFFERSYATDVRVAEEFGWRRAPALAREAALLRRYVSGGRLLDVGCAGGEFARQFSGVKGWELHGVELSPVAVARARQVDGFAVLQGDILEARYPDGYFDAAVILDALQYVLRPDQSLREVHRVLRPGGILLVELPAYHYRRFRDRGLRSWLSERAWGAVNPYTRFYYFTRSTFQRLAAACGFELVEIAPERAPVQLSRFQRVLEYMVYHGGWVLLRLAGWEAVPRLVYVLRGKSI